MKLGMQVGLSPGHIVLDGDPVPKGHSPPIFGLRLLYPNGWMEQDATWYAQPRRLCVRCGPISPTPKKGHISPYFSAHVYCGQTAGWIKMPIGMEVGLGSGDIVLDGDPAFPQKGAQQLPTFLAHLLWPNGRPSHQLLSSCCLNIQ